MFARLVYDRVGEQLAGIEVTDREAIEPGFVTAGRAPDLRSAAVPVLSKKLDPRCNAAVQRLL